MHNFLQTLERETRRERILESRDREKHFRRKTKIRMGSLDRSNSNDSTRELDPIQKAENEYWNVVEEVG